LLALTAVIALVVLAVPSAGAGQAPAGRATATESYPVPASGVYRLTGHGLGHGIGMSQFGAQGMGLLGKSDRQILRFYYPGTTLEQTSGSIPLRVRMSGLTSPDGTTVAVTPGPGLRATVAGTPVDLPTGLGGSPVARYRVVRHGAGLVLRAETSSTTTRLAAGPGSVVFSSARHLARSRVSVNAPGSGPRTYHGQIVVSGSGNGLLVVDRLPLETYLRSVVALEVPSSWSAAALQAQAVAARSYALVLRAGARAVGQRFDICDTTSCQAFGSVATESAAESRAVRATSGRYLASRGQPALTQFSAANGGWSVAGSRSYLVAQADPYDGVVTGSANWGHDWQTSVSAASLERAFPAIGKLRTLKVLGRDGHGQWGGRVQSVALVGSARTVSVSGDAFRFAVGLDSTWWTVAGAASSKATPKPRAVAAVALDRSVRVRWRSPHTQRSVTGYQVTVSPSGETRTVGPRRHRLRFPGLVNGVAYTAQVRARYAGGRSRPVAAHAAVPTSPDSYFRPVIPIRVLDAKQLLPRSGGGTKTVRVTGIGNVPAVGVRAVVVRVSVRGATPGAVQLWRPGKRAHRLTAATYARAAPGVGTATVPVDTTGRMAVATTVPARSVKVDVLGYFTVSGVRSWTFHGLPAVRVADTRTGTGVPPSRMRDGGTAWVRVAGRTGVPGSGATAVLVNATLIHPRTSARLSLAEPGVPFAQGLAVRAPAGVSRSSSALVRLDDRGRIPLRLAGGGAGVSLDVLGWYGPHDGSAIGRFRATRSNLLSPQRDGSGSPGRGRPGGRPRQRSVGGAAGSGLRCHVARDGHSGPGG
jgi:SpoIID/LytB domain protein